MTTQEFSNLQSGDRVQAKGSKVIREIGFRGTEVRAYNTGKMQDSRWINEETCKDWKLLKS
jgi:hypothetical protein